MSRCFTLAASVACLGSCITAAAELPPDVEIEKMLVGKWAQEEAEGGGSIKFTTTFEKSGRFSGEAVISKGDRTVRVLVTGTWKVSNRKLIEVVEMSNS